MKKLLVTLLLLTSLFGCVNALWAEEISAYDINIDVKQSGELFINETIDYDFGNLDKHGIFRDIPFTIKYKSAIKDLGLNSFHVEMDRKPVEWKKLKKQSKHAGEIIRLKIGSPSRTISGKHQYRISYMVKKGVLPAAKNQDKDAIRWNVIGTGWNVPIKNIRATFFLPDTVSKANSTVSTFSGAYGSTQTSATSKWIGAHQLQVNLGSLQPFEGLTVEIAYPANLLDQHGLDNVKQSFADQLTGSWHWLALLGFLAYFWREFKRYSGFSDKRSIAVQYNPPKGLSLLRSGLLLDKRADNEDFAAAIMELGYLGYLEIDQREPEFNKKLKEVPIIGGLIDKASTTVLTRTDKPAEGLSDDQDYLLNKLLFNGNTQFELKSGSRSKAEKLKDGFDTINKRLYAWVANTGYMQENPREVRTKFLIKSILLLLPVLALTVFTIYKRFGADSVFVLIFPVVFGVAGMSVFFAKSGLGFGLFNKVFGLVFAGFGMMPLLMLFEKGLTINQLIFGPIGVLLLLIAVLFFVYKKLGRFTPKGAAVQKQLLGLKQFIKRVKQDEIKRRLAEDPLYLEKLLPYAVLFGETKHWLHFFDELNVSAPVWYHGDPSGIQHFSSSVSNAATPPGSSGGGGFSGGGGSSGGGGGGGGGGSW